MRHTLIKTLPLELLLICLICVPFAIIAVLPRESTVSEGPPDTEPLSCTIHAEPTCEMGKAPKVTVAIKNRTTRAFYLVGSLDASDCKLRYPHCYFEVTGPNGELDPRDVIRFCGNMNTLREQDFVKVPAGKLFDPYQHLDHYGFFSAQQLSPHYFRTAGEYHIRFVYSTKCDTIAKWAGDGRDRVANEKELVDLFNQVPKVEIKSNEIKVIVAAPRK